MLSSTPTVVSAKEIFERFPFGVIFSKIAPTDGRSAHYEIDYDKDFNYYYFSPGLEERSGLRRTNMLKGINAKRDFPVDYKQYFLDDLEVMQKYDNGTVKAFCEPWDPLGVVGDTHFVYTRKTAMNSADSSFMLGTFELVGGNVLGRDSSPHAVAYDATAPLSTLGESSSIPEEWFADAFHALPIGLAVANLEGTLLTTNQWWDQLAPSEAHLSELREITTSTTAPLTTAHWLQQGPAELGRGVYHICNPQGGLEYAVYVLRPAMLKHADPYYVDGKLAFRS